MADPVSEIVPEPESPPAELLRWEPPEGNTIVVPSPELIAEEGD